MTLRSRLGTVALGAAAHDQVSIAGYGAGVLTLAQMA